MMPKAAPKIDPALRLTPYRETLRRLIVASGLPVGTLDAVPAMAEALRSRPQFRVRLLSFIEGLLRRETEPVGALELLGLLTSAARGAAVDLADPELRESMSDLLAFAMEAERAGSGIDPRARGVDVRRPRVHLRPEVARSRFASADDLEERNVEEPVERGLVGPVRRAHVLVASFCVVTGLVLGLLSRGHSALQEAPHPAEAASGTPLPESDGAWPMPDVGAVPPSISEPAAARNLVEMRGARRAAERHSAPMVAQAHGKAEFASRKSEAAGNVVTTPVVSRSPVVLNRLTPAPSVTTSASDKLLGSSQVVNLQPASFQPASRSAGRDAIAKALLRGTEGDSSRDFMRGATALHPSVVAGSAGIMAANVLSSPAPAYPTQATASHVQGEVVIQAVVGRDGRVIETRVVSGPVPLQAAALGAVSRWNYRPYVVGGKPAEIATTAILDFRLGR